MLCMLCLAVVRPPRLDRGATLATVAMRRASGMRCNVRGGGRQDHRVPSTPPVEERAGPVERENRVCSVQSAVCRAEHRMKSASRATATLLWTCVHQGAQRQPKRGWVR